MSAAEPSKAGQAPPRWLVLSMVIAPALGALGAVGLAIWRGQVSTSALILFGAFYLISAIGVEIGLHRYFSHRTFKCGPVVRFLLGAFGSMAGQGPVLFWAAVHREHHRFADTELDPHAPGPRGGVTGFWRAHIAWLFTPRVLQMSKVLPDLIRDPTTLLIQRTYGYWLLAGLAAPALLGGALGGPYGALEGFLWGGLVRMFVNHHVTWSINSVCHTFGARPNPTRDNSRNVWLLALPSLGGAWHNNHHALPRSATNDFQAWQLDPGAWIIRSAAKLGWVWDVREPPASVRRRERAV